MAGTDRAGRRLGLSPSDDARTSRCSRRVYDRTVLVLAVVLLLANALFNVIVWPRFYPRIAADPRARDADGRRTTFYTVHVVLIALALVLAAASAVTALVILL